jgi:hypothetical protein
MCSSEQHVVEIMVIDVKFVGTNSDNWAVCGHVISENDTLLSTGLL